MWTTDFTKPGFVHPETGAVSPGVTEEQWSEYINHLNSQMVLMSR